MIARAGILVFTLGTLAGCTFGVPIGERGAAAPGAVPRSGVPPVNRSEQGNPPSYVVFGQRYHVLDDAHGFRQRGLASWYGTKFHGRRTSSGEIYDMYAMTAAHKTLPIPIYVHVRNLENGRSAVVKVNDRGPFIEGRIIDLSWAAARKLGVDGPGTAKVEVSVLEPGQVEPDEEVRTIALADAGPEDVPLFVQTGSFSNYVNATNMVRSLLAVNESAVRISRLETEAGALYRVRVGPLYDMDEANAILQRLHDKGFQTARIVVQEERAGP